MPGMLHGWNGATMLSHKPRDSLVDTVHPHVQISVFSRHLAGADLSALLSEAQLAAVHEVLDTQQPGVSASGQHAAENAPVVTMTHLRAALSRARPSISAQEAVRLTRTYTQFRDSRDPFASPDNGGKRATLA